MDYSLRALDLATYRLTEARTLETWATVLDRGVYRSVLLRSLLGAAIVTAISVALAFPYAYLVVRSRSPATRKFLLVALFLPFFIGQVVRAYGWLIILGREGLVNGLAGALGLGPFDLIYNYPAVILGLVQYMTPFAVLMLIPALAAVPEEVELASEGLGAAWPATFRHVVIPLAAPGLAAAGVVVFTLTLTDFAMPEILGGGGNDFIASQVYDSWFQHSNPALGSALAIALTLVGSGVVALMVALAGSAALGLGAARR